VRAATFAQRRAGCWLLVVGCWWLVVGEIARKNACKFMRQRMLHVQVAQVAYFCVCRWFFSGWWGWGLLNMLMEE
jgi:hypothetical protein